MTASKKRDKYRNDEEYRKKQIIRVQKYQANLDPIGKKIQKCSKKLYSLRESLNYHLDLIEKLEKRIYWWLAKREKLYDKRKTN